MVSRVAGKEKINQKGAREKKTVSSLKRKRPRSFFKKNC
jgi:hypothetical protein